MKKTIGYVHVCSGQILLVDPSRLGDWKHGDYPAPKGKSNHYDAVSKISLSKKGCGSFRPLLAVASATGLGDGAYPVSAEVGADGIIERLTIEFC